MTQINTGNLQLGSQMMNAAFNPTSSFNKNVNTGAIYAEKGEPTYQKDMDADEDGIITFQEFNDYCEENDVSYAERKQMLENRLTLQLHKENAKASAKVREIKPQAEAVYAKEGERNYDEAIDANKDGKITYEEYLKYCEENKESTKDEKSSGSASVEKTQDPETNEEKFVVRDSRKAMNSYANTDSKEPDVKIESEA